MLTVVFAALLTVFLLLVVTDAYGIRTAILSPFSGGEPDEGTEKDAADALPLLSKEPEENVYRMYWDLTEENALDSIVPAPFYTRVIRVGYGWGGRVSARRWTLTVEGDCWRMSDAPDEIFCDGEFIYAELEGNASVSKGTSWETEIGATVLDDLLSRIDSGEYEAEITVVSHRTFRLLTTGEDHFSGLYEIDVESGLILSEQIRYDNEVIRSIATESRSVSEPYPVGEDYAARVREFYERHPGLAPAA